MTGDAFSVRWDEGATAQLELFSPDVEVQTAVYQLKYTPPFRSTLRPPVEKTPLGPGVLQPINDRLQAFTAAHQLAGTRSGGAAAAAAAAAPAPSPLRSLELVGKQLFELVLPQHVKIELRTQELFLEIGIDEELLNYPWELMHDGRSFLCERHFVGRFVNVNSGRRSIPPQAGVKGEEEVDKLSVLLVSVPHPPPRNGMTYERLPEAEAETVAIMDTLAAAPDVEFSFLRGQDATFDAVFMALQERPYHIIHYNGHARFDAVNPHESGLVLHDMDMTTGPLVGFFGGRPPILSFINACESARAAEWEKNYDVFSLARAFLETGSYLVGSRWKLTDTAADIFARTFYETLISERRALGRAMQRARAACREATLEGDFGWASYVLYGDPRVCFRN
jgi:CHAT domain-containing protein